MAPPGSPITGYRSPRATPWQTLGYEEPLRSARRTPTVSTLGGPPLRNKSAQVDWRGECQPQRLISTRGGRSGAPFSEFWTHPSTAARLTSLQSLRKLAPQQAALHVVVLRCRPRDPPSSTAAAAAPRPRHRRGGGDDRPQAFSSATTFPSSHRMPGLGSRDQHVAASALIFWLLPGSSRPPSGRALRWRLRRNPDPGSPSRTCVGNPTPIARYVHGAPTGALWSARRL